MPPEVEKTWTVERLRRTIVAAAAVLLLAILGFILYGRWRLRHIAQDLPAKLGLSIQQTTEGYVLSKTEKGRTVFKLRAARAVEFKLGQRVSLHRVEIDFYNRSGSADSISGDEFEYDPHTQVVQSQGTTHIVLYPPPGTGSSSFARENGDRPIRLTTHGLVFDQKNGVATCSGEVDFEIAGSSGRSNGADYDSKVGRLTLRSDVSFTTTMRDRPGVLRAARAVYLRNEDQVKLTQPRLSLAGPHGTERADADNAIVTLRGNGSVERLEGRGNVRLVSGAGTSVYSREATANFGLRNQPQDAQFAGGVQVIRDSPADKTVGRSQEVDVVFTNDGRARQITFDKDVNFGQRIGAGGDRALRTLAANSLVLHLSPRKTRHLQLRAAEAIGNAVFTSRSEAPGRKPANTSLAAQTLKAQFLANGQIGQVDGLGQTRVRTVAANGDTDTSTGDTLHVVFTKEPSLRALASQATEKTDIAGESIQTAVQMGRVVLRQIGKAKTDGSSGPVTLTATASKVEYTASNDSATLTGNPQIRNEQLEISASRIELGRKSGDVSLSGPVQATLASRSRSAGGPLGGYGPTHVISNEARLLHATQTAIFSDRARLWQGSDSIAAPVIEMTKDGRTLKAFSDRPCDQCVVGTFLSERGTFAEAGFRAERTETPPETVRVFCGKIVYSNLERKGEFLGHVRVVDSNSELLADWAEIFLASSTHVGGGRQNFDFDNNNSPPSTVHKMVATGNVRLKQPGRRARGARLIYTAADGRYVLTGDSRNPPEVFDENRGTVTGQTLTFSSPGQAIIVSGTNPSSTRTITRVKRK